MKILVTAASKHGSTAEIASALAAGLRARGADVDIAPPDRVRQVIGYDAVVIGSAIYVGHWLRPAKDLIERFAEDLSNRAVYLFSSGPIGQQDRPVNVPPDVPAAIDATGAREHRMFAGKLDLSVLGVGEKVVARMAGAHPGDFRDWDAVGQWAGEIVDAVGVPHRQSSHREGAGPMINMARPDDTTVREAVESACRAPSLHNSQPWRWEWRDGRLRLYADESRILGETDPNGRQLVISCGAALHHLRVALSSTSWSPGIARLPDPSHPDLLAVIDFDRPHGVHPRDAALALAIRQRHTDRRPFAEPATLRENLVDLENAARDEGASLVILDREARPQMVKASELSASIRKFDAAYREELAWWAGHPAAAEGVPDSALLSEDTASEVSVQRRFPGGTLTPNREGADASALAVLSTKDDTRLDWLRSGEALSAVLLEATAAHLATCPLTHLTEIEASRGIVRSATARAGEVAGFPQVVIRIGSREVPKLPATGRRPLDEVFFT